MPPNKQLALWIKAAGIAQAEAARRVEYDRGNFHRVLSGNLKPTLELAHRIELLTEGDIPMAAWVGFEPGAVTERAA